ncbi:MAG: N-acetylmuramoyl-L-alanine amidase [Sarcina sp.]
MKIAVRGGHNFQAKGAVGIIDETTEDRKVKDAVIKYLKKLGHEVLDVTPENMSVNADLVHGVNSGNAWKADLFISIHFNKAYPSYTGIIGTEGWVYNTNSVASKISDRICQKLSTKIGFKNRGTKTGHFYELRNTNMPSIIVEVCFVEATGDVELYKKAGSDKVGQVIAEAIVNQEVPIVNEIVDQTNKKTYRCITGSFSTKENATARVQDLKDKGLDSFIAVYKDGNNDIYRCVAGSFATKENADERIVELKSKGFDSFILIA